jgi:hypothetical protein
MKKILAYFLVIFLSPIYLFAQNQPSDDLYLRSQEDVDNFPSNYPNITNISGDLVIEGNDILQLDSLYQIVSIEGELKISDCDTLYSISGLSNLNSVNSIYLSRLKLLKRIDCFENITSVEGSVFLHICDSVSDISSLHNITEIGIELAIYALNELNTLEGFENLSFIGSR